MILTIFRVRYNQFKLQLLIKKDYNKTIYGMQGLTVVARRIVAWQRVIRSWCQVWELIEFFYTFLLTVEFTGLPDIKLW